MKCWQKLYFTTQLEIEFPFIYVVLNSYTTSNNKWQRIESIGHHNNYLKWLLKAHKDKTAAYAKFAEWKYVKIWCNNMH